MLLFNKNIDMFISDEPELKSMMKGISTTEFLNKVAELYNPNWKVASIGNDTERMFGDFTEKAYLYINFENGMKLRLFYCSNQEYMKSMLRRTR